MAELLLTLGSSELTDWMAFYSLEPWGPRRDDLRAGIVASTVANFASRQLPEGKSCAAADFFPDPYAEPEAPPSAEEMRQALALALGGPSDGR